MVLQAAARNSIYRKCRPEYRMDQRLELEANATPEEAIRWDQYYLAVVRGERDIALSENIPAVRDDFGMPGDELRQLLAQLEAKVRVKVVGGLTVRILLRDDRTVDPAVAGDELSSGARNFRCKAGGGTYPILGRELVAQGGFHWAFVGRQGTGIRVNHGHIEVAG